MPAELQLRHPEPLPSGWSCDKDFWLWRRLRPGEPSKGYWKQNQGFFYNGKVYCREVSQAKAFDKHNRS